MLMKALKDHDLQIVLDWDENEDKEAKININNSVTQHLTRHTVTEYMWGLWRRRTGTQKKLQQRKSGWC